MSELKDGKLKRLAAYLGVPQNGDTLRLQQDGIAVALTLGEGKTTWLVQLSAALATSAASGDAAIDQDGSRLSVEGHPVLTLRPESTADRVGKRLRMNRELHTGDAHFDQRVYIESDAPDAVLGAVLASDKVRAGVLALIEAGCGKLELDARAGTFETSYVVRKDGSVATPLKGILAHLVSVVGALPVFRGDQTWRPPLFQRLSLPVCGTLMWVGIGLTVAGGVLFPTVEMGAFVKALFVGLGIWLPVTALAALLARGTSRAWRTLGYVAIPLFVGLPLCGGGGLVVANGYLDREQPTSYTAPIVDKKKVRGNKSTKYFVHVREWRPGSQTEFKVSEDLFLVAEVGRTLAITIGPGRYGIEWIVSIEVVPAAPE